MGILETLKRSELFLGLDNAALQKIVDLPSTQETAGQGGDVIFEPGDEARYLYVVVEGRVNLVVNIPVGSGRSEATVVQTIAKGGVFGWSAIVPPPVRIMSAVTCGSCKVVAISGKELRALFDKNPQIGYEVTSSLVRIISSRVRNIEQLVVAGKRANVQEKRKTNR